MLKIKNILQIYVIVYFLCNIVTFTIMCFWLNRNLRFLYLSEIKGVESFLPFSLTSFSLDPSHIYIIIYIKSRNIER